MLNEVDSDFVFPQLPQYLFKPDKYIRMTPRTVDELKIAAEIVQYHFLRSRQKALIFHMHPS